METFKSLLLFVLIHSRAVCLCQDKVEVENEWTGEQK